MAGKKQTETKRPIESYEHRNKTRVNNPPAGLVTPQTDPDTDEHKKRYAYDPHLDPQLVWAGKAEHTSFETPTVSLHVHERIDPRTSIEAVRKLPSPAARGAGGEGFQLPLFGERRHGGQDADELHRPALWHQARLQLPALRQQARREGWPQRRPDLLLAREFLAEILCSVPTRRSAACAVWRDWTHRTRKVHRRGCQHE